MPIHTFQATVLENKKLTDDVIFLSLSAPTEFSFRAGQFITLRLENGSEFRLKSYSVLNPPSEKGKVDLCIKLIAGGFASEILRKAKKGDSFQVKGPLGHFAFEEDDLNQEIWMIGGGTGVAPLYSMLKEHLAGYKNTKFVLVFGVKEKKDLFFDTEFQQLARKYANFTYIPTLTREEWKGAKGRVQAHLPANVENKTFYICGLKELVLETKEILVKKGVALKNVKSERYS
ncbi:MAG TPA: FAD-binding oxidoreductase [Candidatus Nanoarchaeia archaeon]|nr:FAD-binding oxidoreductase [Candidatus Nanoarchaeia archaeon]